jgi:hypothetical protein
VLFGDPLERRWFCRLPSRLSNTWPSMAGVRICGQVVREQAIEELVELFGIPPAIHEGFAGSQRALGHDAPEKLLFVDLDIPRPIAADFDIGAA